MRAAALLAMLWLWPAAAMAAASDTPAPSSSTPSPPPSAPPSSSPSTPHTAPTPAAASEFAGAPSGVPETLTLAAALQLGHAHQPQLRQARAQNRAAAARVGEALGPLLPQVDGTAGYQRTTANFAGRPGIVPQQVSSLAGRANFDTFDYFTFGLTATQLVYDFGRSIGSWKAAKHSASAQQHDAQTTLVQVDLGIRSAFFAARADKALLGVAQQALANQQRHRKQIEGFVQAGTRPEIDLAQARTDEANARVQLVNAESNYLTAKARLLQAMGIDTVADFDVADDTLPPVTGEDAAADTLVHEALGARPELQSLHSQIASQQMQLRSVRGNYFPSIGVATNFDEAGESLGGMAWNWSASATLSWNLFQGGSTAAHSDEVQANIASLQAQVDIERQQVRLDVEKARLAVRSSKASVAAAADAVTNAKEQLRLAEGRYETGVGSSLELSDAQLALTQAQAQAVQAAFNLATARAQLLAALGRP